MFDLLSVEIEGFKSFRNKVKFKFPKEPGLYYLNGRNEYDPGLGANGCGKTTLIDAIEWCFYGSTARGLKAGDIISWGLKKASVIVTVVVDGQKYKVARTQGPNAILIDDETVEQSAVTDLLRMNQEAFNYSIMVPQFGQSFFDLSPTPKLALFSSILGLDRWLDKSKEAARLASEVEQTTHELENKKSSLEARIETHTEALKDLRVQEAKFNNDRKAKVRALKTEQSEINQRLNVEQKLEAIALRKVGEAKEDLEAARKSLAKKEGRVDPLLVNKGDINGRIRTLQTRVDGVFEAVAKLQKLGPSCRLCGQTISKNHIAAHERDAAAEKKRLMADVGKATSELEEVDEKIREARRQAAKYKTAVEDAQDAYRIADSDYRQKAETVRETLRAVKVIEKALEALSSDSNPYTEVIAGHETEKRDREKKLKKVLEELEGTAELHAAVSFWIGGFKRIRLHVIEETLRTLELEVNNQLVGLGLAGWTIKFDIERENKSGSISKGFSVFIQSPKYDKPVRWEAWSGGEVQRLRLAGDLGLANLILDQAGHTNLIEFYDEPSEHLSTEGVEDMVETLYDRAHSQGKRIWLVDHTTIGFGQFSGVLTAVMAKDGSTHLEFNEKE